MLEGIRGGVRSAFPPSPKGTNAVTKRGGGGRKGMEAKVEAHEPSNRVSLAYLQMALLAVFIFSIFFITFVLPSVSGLPGARIRFRQV